MTPADLARHGDDDAEGLGVIYLGLVDMVLKRSAAV